MKMAILGDQTATEGFKALGLDAFAVGELSGAQEVWQAVDPEKYSVIFVTEPVYRALIVELEPLRERVYPVVTVIPSVLGGRNAGRDEIRALVEKAVGTDIMFREE
ncbi:MAG: V-type ATP synthase subunit F [Actinobacteria bacterium]|nr:V-type ATP synthase subunit F [Actinomycetota bacterium]MBU1943331.1 V-type ATP synthase subunit F [Actinomycetota bacterium]MBU2686551.1 V-type ATP synthase subunit F [Actinomycetota bacterium]